MGDDQQISATEKLNKRSRETKIKELMKKLIPIISLCLSFIDASAQTMTISKSVNIAYKHQIFGVKLTHIEPAGIVFSYPSGQTRNDDTLYTVNESLFCLKMANIIANHRENKDSIKIDTLINSSEFKMQSQQALKTFNAEIKELMNDNTAADWGMSTMDFDAYHDKRKQADDLSDSIRKIIYSNPKMLLHYRRRDDLSDSTRKKSYGKQNVLLLSIRKDNLSDSIRKKSYRKSEVLLLSTRNRRNQTRKDNRTNWSKNYKQKKVDYRAQLQKLNRESKDILREKSKPSIFLSGSAISFLNKSLNNDSIKSNVTSLGIHAVKANLFDFDADITFSQSDDIIKSADRNVFGSSILVPGIRKFSLLTNYRKYHVFNKAARPFFANIGSSFSINVTQVQWLYNGNDSSLINKNQPVRVIPLAVDFGLTYDWITIAKDRSNVKEGVRISTDVGICSRTILGNLGQSKILLEKFLGSPRVGYIGLYAGFNVKIQRVTMFFNGVILPNYGISFNGKGLGRPVPGLTGGQLVSNLGFRADIVKF